ncbi:COG3958 Transketolase, C-terminal subunit [Candidatus Planktophila versatilis]|jgi:transketolase
MRSSFVDTLIQEARQNPAVVLVTGDLGFGVLEEFASELPNQFINAGIAEQSMMGMAAGLASTGKRVFVYSIGNFPTLRCLEQIRNDVCMMNNSVVVVSVGAGYAYGVQGYTHHALEDVSVLRSLPNMEIYSPSDTLETKEITKLLANTMKPAYLRLGKVSDDLPEDPTKKLEFGKFRELVSGNDGTILFTGSLGSIALNARKVLLNKGLEIAVCSVPMISNIDITYLEKASNKGLIVTIEEQVVRGGFGSAVLEAISLSGIDARIGIIGATQKNLSLIGDQQFLRKSNGISSEAIVDKFNSYLGD